MATFIHEPHKPLARWLFAALILATTGLEAQEKSNLDSLSVDDLMNVEVTSVARKGERLADTPAAVFVISQEDIRRSGATSIPEVLRMVPGLDVARVDGSIWAISARGSNSRFADKMLVMIDGRSVYTPEFSGVFWDAQDTPLEDIDRIEVIRGPGGTLWGANAVNGIINIITKHSIDTQGTLISSGDDSGGAFGTFRHGGSFMHNGYYRAYAKAFDRPATTDPAGAHHPDEWNQMRAGFRADWVGRTGDSFTAEGDAYRGDSNGIANVVTTVNPLGGVTENNERVQGTDLLFRWSSIQSSRSDTTLQAYFDAPKRKGPLQRDDHETIDVDFQHRLKFTRSEAVWGLGFRQTKVDSGGDPASITFKSLHSVSMLASAFIQDELAVSDRLHLTAGSKVEYTAEAGLQLQPTLRALFKLAERATLWTAATSAVRTPSQFETDETVNLSSFPTPFGKPGMVVIFPNPDLRAERVNTYEVGARWLTGTKTSIDATAFHSDMNRLHLIVGSGAPYFDPAAQTVIVPLGYSDTSSAQSDGVEVFVTHNATANWDLSAGYSLFDTTALALDGTADPEPKHQIQLRSALRLPSHFEMDSAVYFVDRLGGSNPLPSYTRLDVQMTWHPKPRMELSLAGQNLLGGDQGHSEIAGAATLGSAVPVRRSMTGKITWKF